MHHPNENSHLNFVPDDIDDSLVSFLEEHPLSKTEEASLPKPEIELITEESLDKLSGDRFLTKKDEGGNTAAVDILQRIFANGGRTRKLQVLPDDYRHSLEQLKNDFPNFTDVIEYLRLSFNKSIQIGTSQAEWRTPILLLGSPGVGKTHFATELTKILKLPFKKIDFSVANANFGLIGQERGYTDACEGELFNLLIDSKYANPVVFIDEVDKCTGDHRYSPTKVLLSFLEKESASQFQDTFIKQPINAQHINWIFTANDESLISGPILSRMRVFNIEAPTKAQTKMIAQNLFKDICATYPLFPKEHNKLSDDVLEALGSTTPRKMRMVLDDAIGLAIEDQRENIIPSDLKLEKQVEKEVEKLEKQNPIGFH